MTSSDLLIWALWTGVGLLTVTSIALLFTRWGKYRPMRKCVVLSLLAHLNLLGYAWTVQIVNYDIDRRGGEEVRITMVDDAPVSEDQPPRPTKSTSPWDELTARPEFEPVANLERIENNDSPPLPERNDTPRPSTSLADHQAIPRPFSPATQAESSELPTPEQFATADSPRGAEQVETQQAETVDHQYDPLTRSFNPPEQLAANSPPEQVQRDESLPDSQLFDRIPRLPNDADAAVTENKDAQFRDQAMVQAGPETRPADVDAFAQAQSQRTLDANNATSDRTDLESGLATHPKMTRIQPGNSNAADIGHSPLSDESPAKIAKSIPPIYQLRTAANRAEIVAAEGGSAATEAAVQGALAWLARNQSGDGRWSAIAHGGGREQMVNGHERGGALMNADAAITGLSLLAFLGDGHTHNQGEYKDNVRKGIEYLLRIQGSDGNLTGGASQYAGMYCHGMATYALAEAYVLSNDEQLREPLQRAIQFTLAAQSAQDGGWRYQRGDLEGDTSQLGWQLLALTSAEAGGIEIPQATRDGMVGFLKGVTFGEHGGIASYRRREQARRSMTAEALFCKQLLGIKRDNPACDEAGDFLLGELPGSTRQPNYYYWYYGTLAMYQLGGRHWEAWNKALLDEVLSRQETEGPDAGSWVEDSMWGGYGGRAYTTALATLSLEAYYRFAPIYQTAQRNGWGPARTR